MDWDTIVPIIISTIALPFAVSFLKGQQWHENVKLVFSMAVALVASALTLLAQNDWQWDLLIAQGATIWAGAQLIYQTKFKGTDTETKLAEALPWSKPIEQ